MTIYTNNESDTVSAGRTFGSTLAPGTVVALYGELGAGKTAFIRGMAEGLDLDVRVFSPTFTIVNEYQGKIPLFHFDMYRLGGAGELFEIGWEDYLDRGGVCAVEWSEHVEEAFLPGTIRIRIDKIDETTRSIDIQMPDSETGTPDDSFNIPG
jgi:tRNA threonylcarbamoyladenosine biosynthesis protein TsaE